MTGSYTIQYSVADGVGNMASATRSVNVSPAVVSTPSGSPAGGGGGGGSAGSYVTYFSAPMNATEMGTF